MPYGKTIYLRRLSPHMHTPTKTPAQEDERKMQTEITAETITIGETENGLSRSELVSYAEQSGIAGGIFMPHAKANRALKAEIPKVRYSGLRPANMGIRVNVADGNSASSSYNIDPDSREFIDGRARTNSTVIGKMRRVHTDTCGIEGCYVHPVSLTTGLCRDDEDRPISLTVSEFLDCRQYWSVTTIPHLWRTIEAPYAEVDGDGNIVFTTRTGYVKAVQRRGAGAGYKPVMYARHREQTVDGVRSQWWEPMLATLMECENNGPMWVWIPERDSEYYAATFAAPVFGGWE